MNQHKTDPFQALADPSRRAILHLLANESHTVNELASNFDMSRPAVSKHIKLLCSAGFIMMTDKGRERHCELNRDGFSEVQDWIGYFDQFWQSKLKSLETILNKSKK